MAPIFSSTCGKVVSVLIGTALAVPPQVFAAQLPPGASATVTNLSPIESWGVSSGGVLTIDGGQALDIRSQDAKVVFNGGQSLRIDADTSVLNIAGATVDSSSGRGAIQLIDSNATITGSKVTSTNHLGLIVGRNITTPASSSATVDGSTITGLLGGVGVTGFAVLNLQNSTVVGTGATSYGVQSAGATISATGSTITGAREGLQIITDNTGVNASSVTLNDTRVTGGTGSAIVLGSSGSAGTVANITVSGNSELIGGDGSALRATNRSTANLNVDASTLTGNVIAETGSSVALLMQNAATLNGNLQNVTLSRFNTGSTLNGDVQAVAGTATTVSLDNRSAINGNVDNVANLSLNNASTLTGNVNSATDGTVMLDNNAVLTGQINNSGNISINRGAQWNLTNDSSVSNLALNDGVVRLSSDGPFRQLTVGELSGTGSIHMRSDLGNLSTDFLNVTERASGQFQLQIAATGTTPVTAESLKVGNIASGDASFKLGGKETVDAGAFVYRLKQDGQGLYLTPDKDTPSTSANAVLALAGTARSVVNAESEVLTSQIDDRGQSIRAGASQRAARGSDATNLSRSVWIRTSASDTNVNNAWGDGYQQRQKTITGGADKTIEMGGQDVVLGGFVGSTTTDMDLKFGSSAKVDSLTAGAYASTYHRASGVFVNGMVKLNQFDNKAKVTMSDGTQAHGDNKAFGVSGSMEVGKHIGFQNGWFVQPKAGLSIGVVESESYRLTNGLEVDADTMHSVQGSVGVRGGRVLTLENGGSLEPSASLGATHEFIKTNRVKLNNDDSFNDDRASSSLGYGVALKWMPPKRDWQVSGEVGGSQGNTVTQNWRASLRVGYYF